MKVIFIGTLPPIIGLSPYCLHLADALSKKINLQFLGFKVFNNQSRQYTRASTINASYYQHQINTLHVENVLNWYNPFSGLKAGLRLKGDILHLQWWIHPMFFSIFPVILLAKMKYIRIVISVHNILPHTRGRIHVFIAKRINKIVFSFADEIIVHNQRNKERLIRLYHIDETRVSVITHGSFDLIAQKVISQHESRSFLHLPQDKKIVLFFGHIRRYKGIEILIKAFAQLQRETNTIFLLIVGQPLDEQWDPHAKLLETYHLGEDSVRADIGFVPEEEVPYYFSAVDLVVLPYTYLDTHGGVGALALPFHKPLLVTDVGGLPSYVKDQRAIVQPNNADALYHALKQILNDNELLRKLSKDSADLAHDLSWDSIAEKTIAVYQKTVKKKH